MLLELARQLIECAHVDVTEPIPVVFNLSSWTEKLNLADWLARELNNIYYVPRKVALAWVKENKMLLLLDGLDEVRQEVRAKCVETINEFRKAHGMTSLAVCSRSEDYANLRAKLFFVGAIEIQPLTQTQIYKFCDRLGEEMENIKRVLKKDTALREMAETPLLLSVMVLAYRNTENKDILISGSLEERRRNLFDTYIKRMFERPGRSEVGFFKKHDVLHWLSWLARRMMENDQIPYYVENMQSDWLPKKQSLWFRKILIALNEIVYGKDHISTVDALRWDWRKAKKIIGFALVFGYFIGAGIATDIPLGYQAEYFSALLSCGISAALFVFLLAGFKITRVEQTIRPGQRLYFTLMNFLFSFLLSGLLVAVIFSLVFGSFFGFRAGFDKGLMLLFAPIAGLVVGLFYGGLTLIQHYALRMILGLANHLPWRLIHFLDYCVDLIFLRRVGGGYIFVHRLLMEHFADMYTADEK
jgi:hypothetical protein